MVFERIGAQALELLPKNLLSRAVGAASRVELPPPVQAEVNRAVARIVGADTTEAEQGPEAYSSLDAFFTRRLREGARRIEDDRDTALVSPVDGVVSEFGPIVEQTLFQAKGRSYPLVDLVDSGRQRKIFEGGHYATIRLRPGHYHRVHSPTSGTIREVSYIPGHLFPTNDFSTRNVDGLFAVNERLISYVENPKLGRIGLVKVGAACVGRIGLTYHDVETNHRFRRRREIELAEPVDVEHGDELATFHLGSTVIILIEAEAFGFDSDLTPGTTVKLGEFLGSVES